MRLFVHACAWKKKPYNNNNNNDKSNWGTARLILHDISDPIDPIVSPTFSSAVFERVRRNLELKKKKIKKNSNIIR